MALCRHISFVPGLCLGRENPVTTMYFTALLV
jgi:hypothetical protein